MITGGTHRLSSTAPAAFAAEDELEMLRAVLRQRITLIGLRPTARELGMSPTGLSNFLDGTNPFGETVRRARVWLAAHDQREGCQDAADARAIEILVSPLPESSRERSRAWLTEAVDGLRRGEEMPTLPWLQPGIPSGIDRA
jgi:hypothetical protein